MITKAKINYRNHSRKTVKNYGVQKPWVYLGSDFTTSNPKINPFRYKSLKRIKIRQKWIENSPKSKTSCNFLATSLSESEGRVSPIVKSTLPCKKVQNTRNKYSIYYGEENRQKSKSKCTEEPHARILERTKHNIHVYTHTNIYT